MALFHHYSWCEIQLYVQFAPICGIYRAAPSFCFKSALNWLEWVPLYEFPHSVHNWQERDHQGDSDSYGFWLIFMERFVSFMCFLTAVSGLWNSCWFHSTASPVKEYKQSLQESPAICCQSSMFTYSTSGDLIQQTFCSLKKETLRQVSRI